eukprot:1127128-Karenia_brevis.AAC.1
MHACGHYPSVGDAVRVFSKSAKEWTDAKVVKRLEGDFILVEYEIGDDVIRKKMHVNSDDLIVPSPVASSSEEAQQSTKESVKKFQGCRTELPIEDPL